ncbi:hypothetical protein EV363DRAFT_1188543 [Boletus edulis]|nr:hypothetical protein EV363DRAFT_1188543 [Boletus edulis]
MTVMDEDDLGRGPKMERQMVNLRNIDEGFMKRFISGVEENGLQNRIVDNALDLGIVKADINLDSLQPMKTGLYTNRVKWQKKATESTSVLYNGNHRFTYMRYESDARMAYMQREKAKEELRQNPPSGDMISSLKTVVADAETAIIRNGVWLIRFLDLDVIRAHAECALIEHRLAQNKLLPTHQDSDNDAFHTVMNILLQTEDLEARGRYIDLSLKTVGKSPVGRLLRDQQLFMDLLQLFKFEHFRSRDNTKAGLSMRNIISWYPVIAGVSLRSFFLLTIIVIIPNYQFRACNMFLSKQPSSSTSLLHPSTSRT